MIVLKTNFLCHPEPVEGWHLHALPTAGRDFEIWI